VKNLEGARLRKVRVRRRERWACDANLNAGRTTPGLDALHVWRLARSLLSLGRPQCNLGKPQCDAEGFDGPGRAT
jgi:hypothetical protein